MAQPKNKQPNSPSEWVDQEVVTDNGLVVIPKRAKLDDEKMWRL